MEHEAKEAKEPENVETANGTNGVQGVLDRRLTDEEFERYSRQMIVPGMGRHGKSDGRL
jgi:hypothetical protein